MEAVIQEAWSRKSQLGDQGRASKVLLTNQEATMGPYPGHLSSVYRNIVPTNGRRMSTKMTRVCWRGKKKTSTVPIHSKVAWTAPEGAVYSVVVSFLLLIDWTMSEVNVKTGDCIVTSTLNQNTIYAFGSMSVFLNFDRDNIVLSPPSRSSAIRQRRISFSRALRNYTYIGRLERGKKGLWRSKSGWGWDYIQSGCTGTCRETDDMKP